MNDPDRGVMHCPVRRRLEPHRNHRCQSQRITYTYDGANRILTEDYHDGQPFRPVAFNASLPLALRNLPP